MSRRKLEEENVRTLLKMRRSYYVSIPIQDVRKLKWQDGQKVVVERKGDRLIIEDWKE